MAISNDILSSTLRILLDEEVDNLFRAVPLLQRMKEKGGIETYQGGQKLDVPLILSEHSSITQMSSGYEPVNLAVKDVLRNATFNWCDFIAPVVITQKEELSNRGDRAIVSIAEARMKATMGQLQREVEKQLVADASSILTELNTLDGQASTEGFFESHTFASQAQTNTVGGIDKAVFTDFNNQFVSSGGTLSLDDMNELYIQTQLYNPMGKAVDLIVCSPQYYKAYKDLLQQNERYVDEKVLDGGRMTLLFGGAQLYPDPFLPKAGATGDNIISAYYLCTDYIKLAFDSEAQFRMDDFEMISGYAARSANIITRLQAYVSHLACQGIHTDAEA